MVCCDASWLSDRVLQIRDVSLSGNLVGADRSQHLQIGAHHGVAQVDGRALRGDLLLAGIAGGRVAGNDTRSPRNGCLLIRGCRPRPGIRCIEPSHRIPIGIRDLLHQHQVAARRQKPLIQHRRRDDHLVIEVVLLLHGVVHLKCCCGDLDGVGKDFCSVLDLLGFIGKRLFFMLDLHDGVAGLRGIEDDA